MLGTRERGRGRPRPPSLAILSGSGLDHVFYRATNGKPRQLVASEHLIFVVAVIVVVVSVVPGFVVVIPVTVLVSIDSNASVAGAADTGTHGRRVAAGADHRDGRHLADEDSIAPRWQCCARIY